MSLADKYLAKTSRVRIFFSLENERLYLILRAEPLKINNPFRPAAEKGGTPAKGYTTREAKSTRKFPEEIKKFPPEIS